MKKCIYQGKIFQKVETTINNNTRLAIFSTFNNKLITHLIHSIPFHIGTSVSYIWLYDKPKEVQYIYIYIRKTHDE